MKSTAKLYRHENRALRAHLGSQGQVRESMLLDRGLKFLRKTWRAVWPERAAVLTVSPKSEERQRTRHVGHLSERACMFVWAKTDKVE